MKKILILAFSLLSLVSYSQTQINPSGSNSVANINTALKGSITATGTNTYAATMTGFTWNSGEAMDITFINANSGASTFSLNSGGALTLKKESSGSLVDLVSGDIIAGARKRFYHNGTYLVLQSGGGGVASVSGTANQIASTGGTTPVLSIVTNPILPGAPTIASPGNSTQNIVTTDATQTLSNKTLVAPALGTPASGVATNLTGTAAGLTAGTVTTNANLTGDVTSTGNATAIASGVIVDADVNASAAISATKLSNTPAGGVAATTVQAAINELDTEKANSILPTNTQTSSYTFVLTDIGKIVRMNLTATANNLTIPPNSSVAFPVGTILYYEQVGTGITTIVQGSGVTATPPTGGSLVTGNIGLICSAYKTGTDTWEINNGIPIGILARNLGGTGVDNTVYTYTPTLTNSANIAASTAYSCTFYRIGNVVTVSGHIDLDPTTTLTLTTLGISLPIASNFANTSQLSGTGASITVNDNACGVFSDATNDRATLQYICVDVTNHDIRFQFSYEVI